MWTMPRLITGSVLDAARTCTAELPCPAAGARPVIQVTSLLAVHAHSGCAAIETVVVPPAAAIGVFALVTATWHLATEGPVELSELEVQLTVAESAARKSAAITRPIVRVIRLLK
jgi:hypothetical protein